MKHYFSFLVLSLFVFLSLVCPSPVMASTALDFTWTSTEGDMPADGSFSFSGKVNDAIKSWGDSWVGFGPNVTATSRSTYRLTEGTYVFTLKLKWRNENKDNTEVPKIVINNGIDIVCFHKNENLTNDVEKDLKYFVTVPSTGSYTIKVVSVNGERDKFGIRSLTIPSTPISCVYSVNNLIMKVITIDNVSTFELSHASNAITEVKNVNPIGLHDGVASGDAFTTSGWVIKEGKATKEITWTTLPTDNTITRVDFYAWIGSEIGGAFENFNISCTNGDAEPSCTAPNHVDISGNWGYFVGETISLSAQAYSSAGTGSPIAEGNITGYQWKHNGVNIDGATSKTYSLTTTSPSDGGDYSCVVSTGATCSTESSLFGTKVYALQCYTGGETTYNFTRVGTSKVGTVEVPLNSGPKEFKIYAGASQYYGNNTSAVYSDISNYEFKGNEGNFHLEAGLGGTFTFTIDYTDNGAAPKVSVTYPRKTIYLTPDVWDKDDAKFAIYYFISETVKGWTDFMTANDCGMSAEIPLWNGVKMIAARINGSLDAPAFGDGKCFNQTNDITVETSKDYISITGWNKSDYTYGTFSPSTYTISFAGNGNSGGSMSNVTAIPCGEDRTLVANGFTKTGHSFSGWKTDVAVTANGSPVAANGIVADEATISNITSNITLTAQWTAKQSTITFDKEGGSSGSDGATGTYGSAMPSITAPTRTGYDFGGYWDGDNGTGNQYYKADGTSYAIWNKDTEDGTTLYAKWTAKSYTVTLYTNDGTINAGNVTSYTYGVGATLPTNVTKSDNRFMGWYDNSSFTGSPVTTISTSATENKEYWARWATLYTITNGNPSNGTITVNSTAIEGETVSILATPSSGYVFSSWTITRTDNSTDVTSSVSLSSSTNKDATFTMPAYGVTVTATFAETTCTNTYTIDCGSTADYVVPTSGTRVPSTQSNEAGIYTDYYTGYHGEGYYDFKGATSSEIYYAVHLPAAQYTFEVYTATDKDGQYINVYRRTDGESGDISYGGYYYTKMISQPNSYNNNKAFGVGRTISEQNLAEEDYIIGLYSKGNYAAYDQVVITANSDVFCRASTYDVTITGSPAAGQASATGAGSYEEGETVTINATPNRGYSFNTWSADPSVSFSSAATTASNSFSMPASDVALTASYNTLTSRTVTVNNDGNGSGSADLNPAYVGETVTLTATPNTGYRFVNWTTSDGVSFASSTSASTTFTMLDKNVTVQANFDKIRIATGDANLGSTDGYADSNDGSTIATSNVDDPEGKFNHKVLQVDYKMVSAGDQVSYRGISLPVDAGYTTSIASGKAGMGFWYRTESTTDKVLTYFCIGGMDGSNQFENLLPATNGKWQYWYIETDKVDDNTTFGFYINGTKNSKSTGTINANAKFWLSEVEPVTMYSVTVNRNNDSYGTASADKEMYQPGETVTLTATPNEGYRFVNWTTSDGVTFADANNATTTFTMPAKPVTVQANYASSGYVVNYEVIGENGIITSVKDGSGNDISSGDAVASGTVLTFTASPSSGYAVLGWYTYLNSTETLQGNTQNSNTFNYEVTGDITIRVKFATPYTLTLNSSPAAASATVSGGGSYVQGTVVSVSTSEESGDYTFVHWMDGESEVSTSAASNYVMPASNKTLNAVYRQSRISSLSWSGSEDLGSGMEIASSCFDGGCFDTDVTFTFTRGGTVNYYDNTNRSSSLGTVTSGTAINLNDNLRENGIYIECTSGDATLTGVEKTTVGSVYTIWSGSVNVSADYTGVNEAGDKVTLRAEDQDWWLQQVVLGPEHFQTAAVGDTLRVTYTNIEDYAKGAIQTATKYNAIPGNIYNESDGLTVSSSTGVFDLPSSGYYHIITAGSLDSLKNKGIVVKGKGHTITRVSLHASCSNLSLRTTAPDKTTYGDDESINIMTGTLEFGDGGFDLGNWEHQVELDKSCFTNVTVGSIINLYMSVVGDATLSFRCNVPSIIADDKRGGVGCPSYGDISFDRTIDDLYGNTPSVVGETGGYKVMYLKVDADMERRLKETGMILCGKGTLIKVVEGVEDTVTVMPNENKAVPTVVNNIVIYQGGQVTNEEDIMVLGSITYIRHAKGGALSNKLDQWYTFALPFTVSDVEVLDTDGKWYDINAVYYLNDATDQDANFPDGAGHYYLQYLKAENETAIGRDFAARWQYITPGHSLACVSQWVANNGTRYGYPKKDEAYIILFDSNQPSGLSGYWESNPIIRFVGGPQTIDGVAKKWKVEANGEQYWMYANNTLHSFTLTDAYILNDAGTEFVLQESPTIRPFECYVQATESLKTRYAAIPMRGFRIDNTTTGAESIQGSAIRAEKILRNGQLIIIRNGVEYDATGVVIR